MTSSPFDIAAQAAGALAFHLEIETETLSLFGDGSALQLTPGTMSLDTFCQSVAPGDRQRLRLITSAEPCDARLRIIGADHGVRYARLIGKSDSSGIWQGLLVPAGVYTCTGRDQLDLESALRAGIENGEVHAYHQPIVSLQNETLVGFESLARWDRVDGDILSPDDFLPMAAEQGLIYQIGSQVRELAARDGAAWHAAYPGSSTLFVAANATAGEVCEPDFTTKLIDMLADSGLAPSAFKLELSESEVMRDPDAAERAMKQLKGAGISLALDDFGTGYSSLSRLDRFPFDTVKIDQYFVRSALIDPSAKAIVSSVVTIARSYDMTVVAEGIETEQSAQLCRELGCDFGQGYRFSRPLKPHDATMCVLHGIDGRFKPPKPA